MPNEQQSLQYLLDCITLTDSIVLNPYAFDVHINSMKDLLLIIAEAIRSPIVFNQFGILVPLLSECLLGIIDEHIL